MFDSCDTKQQWQHVLIHKLKGLHEKLTQKYAAAQQLLQQQQQKMQSILQDTTNLQTWARTYMWKECLFLVRLFLAIKAKHADKFTQFVTLNQLQLAKFFISSSAENFWSRVGLPEDPDKQVAALEKMKVLFEKIKDEGGRAMQRRREQIVKQRQQAAGGGGEGEGGGGGEGCGLQLMLPSPRPSIAASNIAEGFVESNQEHPNRGDHSKDLSAYRAGGFMDLLMEDDLEEGDFSEAIFEQAAAGEGERDGGAGDKKELETMMMKMMYDSNGTSQGGGGSDDVGNQQEMGLALEMIDKITRKTNATGTVIGTEKQQQQQQQQQQQHDVQELVDRWQAYMLEEEEKKKERKKNDVMEEEEGAGIRNGYRDKLDEECQRIMTVLSALSSSLISIRVVEEGGGGRDVVESGDNSIVLVADAYIGRDVEYKKQLRMRVDSNGGDDNGEMVAIPVFSLPSSLLSSRVVEGNGSESLAAAVKERFREQYYQYREKEVGGRVGIEALVRLWLGM